MSLTGPRPRAGAATYELDFTPACVVFDFDGVIIDSAEIKARAFRHLFKDRPAHLDAIMAFHTSNSGISRFRQFDFICGRILQEPLTQQRAEELSSLFSSLVVPQLMTAGFLPGALELVRRLGDLRIPAFIVSGTPDAELWRIATGRGISQLFVSVHGSPPDKISRLKDLQRRFGFDASRMLFIGDAPSDCSDASATCVRFLGVSPDGSTPFPSGTAIVRRLDAVELPDSLEPQS